MKVSIIPHQPRNKWLKNSGGSIVSAVNGGSISTSTSSRGTTTGTTTTTTSGTHKLWGQEFDGTQDVTGDIDVKGDVKNVINLDASYITSKDASLNKIYNSTLLKGNHVDVSEGEVIDGYIQCKGVANFNEIDASGMFTNGADNTGTIGERGKAWKNGFINNIFSQNITNTDMITTQDLTVLGTAHFFELIIDKIKAIGGSFIATPADGFNVEFTWDLQNDFTYSSSPTYSKYSILLWRAVDADGKARDNMWQVGDQALCKSFNQAVVGVSHNVSNKNYWSVVKQVSESASPKTPNEIKTLFGAIPEAYNDTFFGDELKYHYIIIHKNQTGMVKGTVNPEAGDAIVMLGHRAQPNESQSETTKRGAAIYLSAYDSLDTGLTAPLFAQYRGINDFNLASHRTSYFDATGAKFVGNFEISNGQSPEQYINSLIDSANNGHSPWIGDGVTKDADGAASVVGYWYVWSTDKNGYINSGVVATGSTGLSAFELYQKNGGTLTEKQWLESLVGKTGDSAYDIYIKNGGTLSQDKWLESLDGKEGLSAYDLYKGQGGTLSEQDWLNSLKGTAGKSAYQSYIDGGGTLSEAEWLESLIGAVGKSAYQSYLDTTTDDPKKTETEWLESLDGEPGLSAYDIYVAQGGELSIDEWLASLHGQDAVSHDPYIGANNHWFTWDKTLNSGVGGYKDTGILAEGKDGSNGINGSTPYIGQNGNWYIGTTDTGVLARGTNGNDGKTPYIGQNGNWFIGTTDTGVLAQGSNGNDGKTPYIGSNGNWFINGTDTGVLAQGTNGITPTVSIGSNGNWFINDVDTGFSSVGDDGHSPYISTSTGTWFEWDPTTNQYKDTNIKAEGLDGHTPYISTTTNNWMLWDDTANAYVDSGKTAIGDDGHTPYIGENRHWYEWDVVAAEYKDTGILAQGQDGSTIKVGANGNWFIDGVDSGHSAQGDDGHSPYISTTTGTWWEWDADTNAYVDTNIKAAGTDAHSPKISENGTWLFWDDDKKEYVDSGEDVTGDDGHSPYIGTDGYWYQWDPTTKQYTATTVKAQGNDGNTPYIQSGYWYINGTNTNIKATGDNGVTPTVSIGANGNWFINGTDTGLTSKGDNGKSPYISTSTGTWFEYDASTNQYKDTNIKAAGNDAHSPQVSSNGTWLFWDDSKGEYVDSGEDVTGDDGHSPYIGVDGYWYQWDPETNKYTATTVKAEGDDGDTPYIGANGNWFIGTTDTGVLARGTNGVTPVVSIGANGNWFINDVDTGKTAIGDDGHSPYISTSTGTWFEWDDGSYKDTNIKAAGNDAHSPKVSDDGTWLFWDDEQKKYIDSGKTVKGDDGHSPYIGTNGHWYEWDADANQYKDSGVKAEGTNGNNGFTPYIQNGYWYINGTSTGVLAEASNGDNAEFYKLYPAIETALVGLNGNLVVNLSYLVYHIDGSASSSVSSGFAIRIKDSRSSSTVRGYLSYNSGFFSYSSGTYVTNWHSTDTPTYLTVELYATDATDVVLDSRCVVVSFQPGAMFTINTELGVVRSTAQDASNNASQALQTANGISTTVSHFSIIGNRINLLPGTDFSMRTSDMYISGDCGCYPTRKFGYQGNTGCNLFINSHLSDDIYYGIHWGGTYHKSVKLETGKTYTLSVWAKDMANHSRLNFEVHRTSGVYGTRVNGYGKSYAWILNSGDGWKQYQWSFQASQVNNEIFIFTHNTDDKSSPNQVYVCMPMLAEGTVTTYTLSAQDDTNITSGNMLDNTSNFAKGGNLTDVISSTAGDFPGSRDKYIYSYNSDTYTEMGEWTFNNVIKANTDYVFSFWGKSANNGESVACFFYRPEGTFNPNSFVENSDGEHTWFGGGNETGDGGDGYSPITLTTEWKRYWVHWHTQDYIPSKVRCLLRQNAGNHVYIAQPKLELGVVPSDYTSGSQDFTTLSDVKSEISQSANSINLTITNLQNNLETCGIHLSDGTINLNGSVDVTSGNALRVINSSNQVKAVISPNTIGGVSSLPTGQDGTVTKSWSAWSGNTATISGVVDETLVLGSVAASGDKITLSNIHLTCKLYGCSGHGTSGTLTTGPVTGSLTLYRDSTVLQSWNISEQATIDKTLSLTTSEFTTIGAYKLVWHLGYATANGGYSVSTYNMSLSVGINQSQSGSAYSEIASDGFFSSQGANKYLYTGSDGLVLRWGEKTGLKLTNAGLQRLCSDGTTWIALNGKPSTELQSNSWVSGRYEIYIGNSSGEKTLHLPCNGYFYDSESSSSYTGNDDSRKVPDGFTVLVKCLLGSAVVATNYGNTSTTSNYLVCENETSIKGSTTLSYRPYRYTWVEAVRKWIETY